MIESLKTWRIGLFAIGMGLVSATIAADIYSAPGPDGSVRYSTQPLNKSHDVYLKADAYRPDSGQENRKPSSFNTKFSPLVERAAARHSVDPALVHAVIMVESRFNPAAVSPKGAQGLMQLMPATAAQYGVARMTDPAENIDAGVRYLKDLLTHHKGNVALALASYNAGRGNTGKYGNRIPPFTETMLFVPAVLAHQQAFRGIAP